LEDGSDIMQRSRLSKVFGAGIAVASLAALPLATPASAASESMSNYQMERHASGDQGTMTLAQGVTATSTGSSLDGRWLTTMEFQQMGRHAWQGNGMMTQLRNADMSMMYQRQSGTGTGTMMNNSGTSGTGTMMNGSGTSGTGTGTGTMMDGSGTSGTGTGTGTMMDGSGTSGTGTGSGTTTIPVTPGGSTTPNQ
jgi:hypothetical protein